MSDCPWIPTPLIRIQLSMCTHNPQMTFRIIRRNKTNASYGLLKAMLLKVSYTPTFTISWTFFSGMSGTLWLKV